MDAPVQPAPGLYAAVLSPAALALLLLLYRGPFGRLGARASGGDATLFAGAVGGLLCAARLGAVARALAASCASRPDPATLPLALPLAAAGAWLHLGAQRALGRWRFHYGRQLCPGPAPPWCTAFPYDAFVHPALCGSSLCVLAVAVVAASASPRPGWSSPLLCWLAALLLEAIAEEGLTCPPAGERNACGGALTEGSHPFWDTGARGRSWAEWAREGLMAPVALLRCAAFWGGLVLYGLLVNAVAAFAPGAARRHALLVPLTRAAAGGLLWVCGFTLAVRGRANLAQARRACAPFVVVANHLSYMDILVAAALLGPYAAAARHDLLDWPIIGPVARSWGVVGVRQSDIRERQLKGAALGGGAAAGPGMGGGSAASLPGVASAGSLAAAAAAQQQQQQQQQVHCDGVAASAAGAAAGADGRSAGAGPGPAGGGCSQPPAGAAAAAAAALLAPAAAAAAAAAPSTPGPAAGGGAAPLAAPPSPAAPSPQQPQPQPLLQPPSPGCCGAPSPSPSPSGGAGGAGGGGGGASGAAEALAARAALDGSGSTLPPVLVFPEGTTSAGGCVLAWRTGAFLPGLPVLPLAIKYTQPAGLTLSWASPHATGAHFWRTMCAWGKRVELTVLPVHVPDGWAPPAGGGGGFGRPPPPPPPRDARAFAESVRCDVAACLGWPTLAAGVRDAHALLADVAAARDAGAPMARAPPWAPGHHHGADGGPAVKHE